tara:strand:- start:2168 stop:2548 length:381 start_codon:yes stop_codon:yes gene_type:complete
MESMFSNHNTLFIVNGSDQFFANNHRLKQLHGTLHSALNYWEKNPTRGAQYVFEIDKSGDIKSTYWVDKDFFTDEDNETIVVMKAELLRNKKMRFNMSSEMKERQEVNEKIVDYRKKLERAALFKK